METAATVTRIDVLAAAARRLRQHYKKRLMALYALPTDPYEPEEEAVEALHLVIVLYPPVTVFKENDMVSRLLDATIREFGAAYLIYAHATEPDEALALHARTEGVLL